ICPRIAGGAVMLNRPGRATAAVDAIDAVDAPKRDTSTGAPAWQQLEPLLFEIGSSERCGVDLDEPAPFSLRLGGMEATEPVALPALSEPETMRHYVRLSQKNYGIDTGMFPLGSCTMKHNPRLNEKM